MHDKTILITGGTGSFGRAFTDYVLQAYRVKKIIILSRDEYLQHEMSESINDPRGRLRFFIGDIRDVDKRRFRDVDYVVHAAALKRIGTVEYNPIEAVQTNVVGTMNMIQVCQDLPNVEKAVFLSTDKAVMPVNLYGFTKGTAESLWLDANYYKPIFSVTRYGNVMGSRGSVLPKWRKMLAEGATSLPITDLKMTRFWTTMQEAVDLVCTALEGASGYTYVPKSPAFALTDLAKSLYQRIGLDEVGIRSGEKLHEMLIHEYEVFRTVTKQGYYLITPGREYVEREEPKPTLTRPITSEVAAIALAHDDPRKSDVLSQKQIRDLLAGIKEEPKKEPEETFSKIKTTPVHSEAEEVPEEEIF
jgi:FlaA1/EpsC-like NDP-sugar epimerase